MRSRVGGVGTGHDRIFSYRIRATVMSSCSLIVFIHLARGPDLHWTVGLTPGLLGNTQRQPVDRFFLTPLLSTLTSRPDSRRPLRSSCQPSFIQPELAGSGHTGQLVLLNNKRY